MNHYIDIIIDLIKNIIKIVYKRHLNPFHVRNLNAIHHCHRQRLMAYRRRLMIKLDK